MRLFEGRVWIVSKAGPRIQTLTRRWLAHHGFHERTGVPESAVRFCRERKETIVLSCLGGALIGSVGGLVIGLVEASAKGRALNVSMGIRFAYMATLKLFDWLARR